MKRTRKLILALVVVMSLLMAMAVAIIPASAATITAGTTLYLKPNSNWTQSNARFAAYFFGNGDAWVSMEQVENGVYKVTSPNKNYTNVIFCRMNPSTTANNWNNKWDQTSDLTWNGTNNCYTVKAGTWNKGGGSWSTYTPPAPEHVHQVGTLKNSGTAATCTTAGVIATYNCTGTCGKTLDANANEVTNTSIDALGHSIKDGKCERCEVAMRTIYVTNNHGWSTMNVYSWNDGVYGNNGIWPGVEMKFYAENDQGQKIYKGVIPADATHIIFNNGSSQTVNISLEGKDENGFWINNTKDTEGKYYLGGNYCYYHTYMDGVCKCGNTIDVLEKNSEGVIVLSGNLDAKGVIVFTKDSVIDLNGNTLTANGVITFHESTRFVGEGKLVIPQNGLVLAGETNNMPVWNAEGYYTFPTVKTQFVEETKVIDHDSFNVVFRPTLNDSTKLNQSVFADANAHGLTFRVEIYGKDKAEALYSGNVSNALIAEAYANGKAISLTVNGADTDYEEYTVKLVVVSSTGLVNTTEIGKFIPTEAPEVEETPADAN